jgi:hypothetical protein
MASNSVNSLYIKKGIAVTLIHYDGCELLLIAYLGDAGLGLVCFKARSVLDALLVLLFLLLGCHHPTLAEVPCSIVDTVHHMSHLQYGHVMRTLCTSE